MKKYLSLFLVITMVLFGSVISLAGETANTGFEVEKTGLMQGQAIDPKEDTYISYLLDCGVIHPEYLEEAELNDVISIGEYESLVDIAKGDYSSKDYYLLENDDFAYSTSMTVYDALKSVATYHALFKKKKKNYLEELTQNAFLDPASLKDSNPDLLGVLQANPILAAYRNEKNVDYLNKQTEEEIEKGTNTLSVASSNPSKASPNTNSSPYTLALGTDKTYTTCNFWNYGLSYASGAVLSDYAAKSKCARSREKVTAIGSGSSWALTGVKVKFTGSGSRYANVIFTGSYEGEMVPSFQGGTTSVKGNLVVKDMTTGSIVSSISGINETLSNHVGLHYYTGTQSKSTTVQFQAGHTYVIYFSVGATASNYSPSVIASDFFTPDTGYDFGARMNSIKIEF